MYDYVEAVANDVISYIKNHKLKITLNNQDEIAQELYDTLILEDSVTGNASGSYTFSTWKAEEYLCHNLTLLKEAYAEFCDYPPLDMPEICDVAIRCYVLPESINSAIGKILLETNDYTIYVQKDDIIQIQQELNNVTNDELEEAVISIFDDLNEELDLSDVSYDNPLNGIEFSVNGHEYKIYIHCDESITFRIYNIDWDTYDTSEEELLRLPEEIIYVVNKEDWENDLIDLTEMISNEYEHLVNNYKIERLIN
jgi:uncharacterized protein YacL (UPF0231 family)